MPYVLLTGAGWFESAKVRINTFTQLEQSCTERPAMQNLTLARPQHHRVLLGEAVTPITPLPPSVIRLRS